jgi:hypothetical protein
MSRSPNAKPVGNTYKVIKLLGESINGNNIKVRVK